MKYFIDTKFYEEQGTIDLISIGIVSEVYQSKHEYSDKRLQNTTTTLHPSREFYAISKDFDIKKAWNAYRIKSVTKDLTFPLFKYAYKHHGIKESWLRDNVLKGIFKELSLKEYEPTNKYGKTVESTFGKLANKIIDKRIELGSFTYKNFKRLIKKHGKTNDQIAKEIKEFIAYTEESELSPQDFSHPNFKFSDVKFYGYYSAYDWVVFCWLFGRIIDLPKGFPMYCNDLKQKLDNKQRYYIYRKIADICSSEIDTYPEDYFCQIHLAPNYPKKDNNYNALESAKWNKLLYKFLSEL